MSRLKKGIKNIDKIGVATFRRVAGLGKDVAEKRKEACDKCDFAEPDPAFGGTMCAGKDEKGEACYCNVQAMVYLINKKCPVGKW